MKRSHLVPVLLLLFICTLTILILFARQRPQSRLAALYSWVARDIAKIVNHTGVTPSINPAPPAAKPDVPTPAQNQNPSPLENDVLAEINLARTRPQDYAAYLEQLKPFFKDKTFQPPGQPASATQEGVAALEEAITALRAMKPQSPYHFSPGMSLGANLLVKEQGTKGLTGHKGVDGDFCDQRLARFGRVEGTVGEALSYSGQTPRQRVLTWLIDDGFTTRGHRNSVLNPGYKVAGISCGDHARFSAMCVVEFAGGFSDKQPGNVTRSF